MEQVLDVYKRPYDQLFPVVCMDESPRQLIDEVRTPFLVPQDNRHDMTMSTNDVAHVTFSWETNHWPEGA